MIKAVHDLKKIKVLFINGGLMDRGGISSFICNYLKYFDFEKFDVHIAVHGNGIGQRDDELRKLGCIITNLPVKSNSYIKWKTELKKLFIEEKFDLVHSNADAGNGPILKIAKQCNIKIRISHSHNTQLLTSNQIKILLNNMQRKQIPKYANHLFACSKAAGKWLYGNADFEIINNAIDYTNFKFNKMTRNHVRKELKVANDTFVVGHVGRFDYQKNHKFIISIAESMKEKNIVFLLLGDGHLRHQIEGEIANKNLKNIYLAGEVNNVSDYLNAMDCFIMPSLFEGLSVVSIEAQTNGLKCIFSKNITIECNISKYTNFLAVDNITRWVKMIDTYMKEVEYDRFIPVNEIYDLKVQSMILQEKYYNFYKETRDES